MMRIERALALRLASLPLAGLPLAGLLVAAAPAPDAGIRIAPVALPDTATPLPMTIVGRAQPVRDEDGRTLFRRQWPGTYAEASFRGTGIAFRVGTGEVILHVTVDDRPATALVRPAPGFYAIGGLATGTHKIRIDVVTESQSAPTELGGFYAVAGTVSVPVARRARQIEFIGDSHTVGYGNTSSTRACTEEQVWTTTDTAQGIGAQTAMRYAADYQVDAISGRGIVRNYGGAAGDTVPRAYPYALFDKAVRYDDPAWRPQVIVMALGTNDFSTALKPGEPWATRAALQADYEATYAGFVQRLRLRNPRAFIVLWATDMADGEIEAETRRVVDTLRAAGDTAIAFVPVHDLAFTACNAHPSVADDATIARAIRAAIDARPGVWQPAR